VARNWSVNLFDLLIWLIVCLSLTSISLLVVNKFNAYYAGAAGIGLAVISAGLLRLKINLTLRGIPLALVIILLGSLAFRAQPYLFVPGGQDQGVYVTMSAAYERDGSTFIIDEVREKAIKFGLKDWYDAANQKEKLPHVKPGKYEGGHLPGVYVKDFSRSEYVFQFYPLHPLWMAITGKFIGERHRVYSLVFFSLLSITAFYLLASSIPGGGKTASVLIGVFLALNPLHAYFSKFPTTEIVSLAFSSLGFYYLIRYYKGVLADEIGTFFLILSAGLFACMFFTHIRGFMYTPFFYFLLLITVVFEENPTVRKQLSLFLLSIFGLYALSIIYGVTYSYPYSHDIYMLTFGRRLGASWTLQLTWAGVTAGAILLITFLMRNQIRKRIGNGVILAKAKNHFNLIACLVLGLVMVIACYKAYQLGFTDQYADARHNLGEAYGWPSVRHSNIFVVMLYLSPVGLGVFICAMVRFFPKRHEPVWTGFLGFLILFWSAFTVFMFLTRHQYYYARYLLGEVIPYTLLAIAIVLGSLFQKRLTGKVISIGLSCLIACFFLYFTVYQFKGRDADGAYASLKGIAEIVKKNDLLVLSGIDPHIQWILRTPLSFFFDLNTCNLEDIQDLRTLKGRRFIESFDDVFLLSGGSPQAPFLIPLRRITYTQGGFLKSKEGPPKHFKYNHEHLNFFKVDKSGLTADTIYPLEMKGNLVNFYDASWTNGNGIIRNLKVPLKPNDKYVRINTKGFNPFLHNVEWPKPELYLNGIKQEFCSKRGDAFTYEISPDVDIIREFRIASATFVPKEEGINKDDRRLGLDIDSIIITDRNADNIISPVEMKKNLQNFHDGIWTNGNGLIKNVNFELRPTDAYASVKVKGWNPLMDRREWPNPRLYINGIEQPLHSRHTMSYVYKISGDIRIIRDIGIASPTFVPKELGLNEDGRKLGVDVDFIAITGEPGAF